MKNLKNISPENHKEEILMNKKAIENNFEKSLYKKIEFSKNGTPIPVFESGRTVDSKYDPQRDAQKIVDSIYEENRNIGFFIVVGIGSGILPEILSKKFPNAKIVCIESSKADIDFLSNIKNGLELVKIAKKTENIILCTEDEIFSVIIQNYIPAKFGDIKIIEQRGWINENQGKIKKIAENIQKALKIVAADYSTQSHFGKIWINNIMNNLKLISQNEVALEKSKKSEIKENIDTSKIAAVIAAGPTLDKTVKKLAENREKYFIISTDTAYSVLLKHKIFPEIVISVDGQNVSYNHFIHQEDVKNTVFLFDLTSNFCAAKYLKEKEAKVIFFKSGHPFSILAENYCKENFFPYASQDFFPSLFAGAGTVTICATDLAMQLGFEKIQVFAADFSYLDGKTYSKGTYLDLLYNQKSGRTEPSELLYAKLMFRTNLFKLSEKKFSTEILQSYRKSFENFVIQKSYLLKIENDCFIMNKKISEKNEMCLNLAKNQTLTKNQIFNFRKFLDFIKKTNAENLEIPLLPLAAWIRTKTKKNDYKEILNLAYSYIVRYNV